MSLNGLGTDIIEITRIERVIDEHGQKFLDRMFTPKEQEYCLRFHKAARHFAGRFAAKEAVVKSLGTGIRDGISWTDIEILNDSNGKPIASLSHKAKELFPAAQFMISISHSKEYATATAIHLSVENGMVQRVSHSSSEPLHLK